MIYERKAEQLKTIEEIAPGTCFQYGIYIFMKTQEECYEHIACVEIVTGEKRMFERSARVVTVNAKVVIE